MDNTVKKKMTDAERLELSKKLDEDLENFINSLEKRKYTDGWPADRWEEEMEKHPFFMKSAPEAGEPLSPLMEGLQQLKYDPTENTPEELANAYKEDGNFNLKHKNYRLAIIAYTEGIKQKCDNKEVQATLYNNRSAAHYFLKNYRSSLKDAEYALKFKPDYEKPLVRAAYCNYEVELYNKAIEICDDLLTKKGPNEDLIKLRTKSLNAIKMKERNSRKKLLSEAKEKQEEQILINTILSRGIQIDGGNDCLKLESLEPLAPQLVNSRVNLDENGKLIWPVLFLYSEYKLIDVIAQWHEEQTFHEYLHETLASFPEWDDEKKYTPNNVNVYLELKNLKLHRVDISKTLGEILTVPGCVIKGGTPAFIVIVRESRFEKFFLKQYVADNY